MCENLVPVCNDVPASTELARDGHNAMVCGESASSMADALVCALNVLDDGQAFAGLRAHARDAVADRDWGVLVRKHVLPVYRELVPAAGWSPRDPGGGR